MWADCMYQLASSFPWINSLVSYKMHWQDTKLMYRVTDDLFSLRASFSAGSITSQICWRRAHGIKDLIRSLTVSRYSHSYFSIYILFWIELALFVANLSLVLSWRPGEFPMPFSDHNYNDAVNVHSRAFLVGLWQQIVSRVPDIKINKKRLVCFIA